MEEKYNWLFSKTEKNYRKLGFKKIKSYSGSRRHRFDYWYVEEGRPLGRGYGSQITTDW
jgi:hypothetical protein